MAGVRQGMEAIPKPVFARFAFLLVAQADIDSACANSRRPLVEEGAVQDLYAETQRVHRDLDALSASNDHWRAMQRWLKGGESW